MNTALATTVNPSTANIDAPNDPEGMNDERAEFAKHALATFSNDTGQSIEDDGYEQIVGDLLANLAHFCDRNSIDLQARLANAVMQYDAETDNQGKQFLTPAPQTLTTTQILALLETKEGHAAMRSTLKAFFPYIGTSEQFSGSECIDRLNEWWEAEGGEIEDQEEEDAPLSSGEGLTKCQDCGTIRPECDLNEIQDFEQRVTPGEPLPLGECPDCGALCHHVDPTPAVPELCECGRKLTDCKHYDNATEHGDR
jgi:hypothetical protein